MFREIVTHALKQLSGPPQPGAQQWGSQYAWHGLPGERNYRGIITDPMTNNLVAACVLWIARNYPKAPVMLERQTGPKRWERVEAHPFLDLQRQPNDEYSGVTMDWAKMISFLTDGNAYKLKRRSDSGRVAEEWYVPHWMLEPKWPIDGSVFISHYAYTPGGGKVYKVDPEDVVHLRYGLDPLNTRKGLSPLKSLMREIYTDEEAARFSATLLHNMGLPGLIVAPKQAVDPNDADAVKAKLQQEFGGDNRGGIMVPHGPTDVTVIGFNPDELDLSALRDVPEERVAAVLGVPAAVVGFGTGMQQTKVGATMAELREVAWQDGIVPLHTLIAPEMERSELSEFVDTGARRRPRGWRVAFDYDAVPELNENLTERSNRILDGLKAGSATLAEWREVVGLEVRPQDSVFLRPFTALEVLDGATGRTGPLAEVDSTSPGEREPETSALPAGSLKLLEGKATWDAAYINDLPDSAFAYIEPGGERDEDGKTTPRRLRHFPHHNAQGNLDLPHLRNALARGPQSDVWPNGKGHLDRHAAAEDVGKGHGHTHGMKATQADARYLRLLDRIERQMAAQMSTELEDRFDALGRAAERTYVSMSGGKAVQLDPEDEQLVIRIVGALGLREWSDRELAPIFRRYTALMAEATYGAVAQRVGVEIGFNLDDPVAVSLIESGGTRAGLVDVPGQTRDALMRAIASARAEGVGPIEIARRIRSEVPAGPYPNGGAAYRAQMIARTETLHAQRASSLAAGQSAGFTEYLIFDARLGDTDADCEILDQSVVTLEQAEALMESEHPNGTRSFSPIPRTRGQASRCGANMKGGKTCERKRPCHLHLIPVQHEADDAEREITQALGLVPVADFRCESCNRKLAEAAGPGTRIKCRCGHTTEAAA